MSRFRRMRSLQKFVSIHSSVHNHFNFESHINFRIWFKQKRDAALRFSSPDTCLRASNGDWFELAWHHLAKSRNKAAPMRL